MSAPPSFRDEIPWSLGARAFDAPPAFPGTGDARPCVSNRVRSFLPMYACRVAVGFSREAPACFRTRLVKAQERSATKPLRCALGTFDEHDGNCRHPQRTCPAWQSRGL